MKIFLSVLKQVFGKVEYLFLFLVSGLSIFVGAIAMRNLPILGQIFSTNSLSFEQKVYFILSFFSSVKSMFGLLGEVLLIIIALLFALNLTLLVFYIRKVKSVLKGNHHIHAVGIGGLVSGLLGIGCAACGSIVLSAILSAVGASGLLLLLPLHGSEFGILGVMLLVFSITVLVRKINQPLVC